MNKKFLALLIAFSLSTTPICANISSFVSGYFGGAGTILVLAGLKKMKEAKTYLTVANNNSMGIPVNNQPAVYVHDWTTDYKDGASRISTGLLALVIAAFVNQFA